MHRDIRRTIIVQLNPNFFPGVNRNGFWGNPPLLPR